MQVYTIPPLHRYGVIVTGGVEVAREAVSRWIDPHHPMRNVVVNGYGAVHADVFCDDPERLSVWFDASHARGEDGLLLPGSLAFYLEKDK